jgi:hypothetical protein
LSSETDFRACPFTAGHRERLNSLDCFFTAIASHSMRKAGCVRRIHKAQISNTKLAPEGLAELNHSRHPNKKFNAGGYPIISSE